MDTFLGIPSNTSSVNTLISPALTVRPALTIKAKPLFGGPTVRVISPVRTTFKYDALLTNNGTYLYDTGIGNNPFVQYKINNDLRYQFLDNFLYEDFEDIIRRLRVTNDGIKVLSKNDSQSNDISKDSVSDLEKKSDFLGDEILTINKVGKILRKLLQKTTHVRYYDLPHNEHFVMKAFAKYIRKKLDEMSKNN